MFGKSKKIVSVAYKEKLLAEIAHYEKRIEEALNKPKSNCFADESFEEDVTNPYEFKLQLSHYELKQREASLSDRASMTLELANLTIMQSKDNVMVTPPEVRKPVHEDGVWHKVEAKCKIDLVSYTITFYAHKPYRKFAPTRYRNVAVTLAKPAHQKELAQSILPKLQLPNLALQVLQSYATAFRSRRTTMLELAETYADKLKMEAMPEGGYRVRFLDLLQVDWTLENLWSPIVPFFHRMKFELEYMPKDYIGRIGKLYKQFKDPSLETSDRTSILSKIFDICLQAAGPAREMQETFESDPETAGRLHERRTTIDQEPEVPNVEQSPKKPSGKENKPQNRKTDMAPPKTIPKKAKKSKPNQENTDESRKSVKRSIESNNRNDAKKSRTDGDNKKSKAGLKGGSTIQDKEETGAGVYKVQKINDKQELNTEKDVGSEINGQKKSCGKTTTKTVKETAKGTVDPVSNAAKKADGKIIKSKILSNAEVRSKNTNKNEDGYKNSSEASSKVTKKRVEKNNANKVNSKDTNTEGDAGRSKKETENTAKIQPTVKNTVKSKDKNKENNTVRSTNSETTTNTKNDKKVGSSKKDDANIGSSKRVGTKTTENAEGVTSKVKNTVSDVGISKRATYTKVDNTKENVTNKKRVNETETVSRASSKSAASGKNKPASRNIKDIEQNGVSKKDINNDEKDTNLEGAVGKAGSDKTTSNVIKKPKDNMTKPKDVKKSEVNNKLVTKGNNVKNTKSGEVSENSKVVKEKQRESAKITTKGNTDKVKAQVEGKRKVNPKSTEQKSGNDDNKTTVDKTFTQTVTNDEQSEKTGDVLAKKRETTEQVTKNIENNNVQPNKSTTNTEKYNETVNTRILKEKTNSDENLEKAVGKNKITQNKTNQKTNNVLNVTISKSKIIPLSKIPAEKQIKIADKLKTKIPMLKNKMTFSSLSNKLGMNNAGKNSNGVGRPKIPQKSLHVFKKSAKNPPTRFSPRKPPTFKPSSKEFTNK